MTITTTTKSYLEVLTSNASSPKTKPPNTIESKPEQKSSSQPSPSTTTSHISSLGYSNGLQQDINHLETSISNIKEHVQRTINAFRQEFQTITTSIQSDIDSKIKHAIDETIRDSMQQLSSHLESLITTSIKKSLLVLSPHKRKHKRNRTPAIYDSEDEWNSTKLSTNLFHKPTSSTTSPPSHSALFQTQDENHSSSADTDETTLKSNLLFETQLTVRPDSPMVDNFSEDEQNSLQQP